jgi:hypothetical protein
MARPVEELMRRSIIAVLAGWTLAVLLINGWKWIGAQVSGGAGSSFLVFLLGIFVSAAAGGYFAALLAEQAPTKHAAVLGVLLACLFIPKLFVHRPEPIWHEFWPVLVVIGGAVVGGSLRSLTSRD